MFEGDSSYSLNARSMKETKIRILTSVLMISLSAFAWLALFYFMGHFMNSNADVGMNSLRVPIMTIATLFSSLQIGSISFFILIWVVGMVAMMFPAMIPVVLIYNGLRTKLELNRQLVRLLGTTFFLGGYLFLYAVLGMGAFAAIYLAFYLTSTAPSLSAYALPVSAGILFAAGVWQLTPLKDRCLSNCVSSFGFFLMHAKRGLTGAFRMGAEYGYYCVGCCYLYMLVMLGVAAMSIPSMILLTTLITIEKFATKSAKWFKWISATIFIALALGLLFSPQLFGFG